MGVAADPFILYENLIIGLRRHFVGFYVTTTLSADRGRKTLGQGNGKNPLKVCSQNMTVIPSWNLIEILRLFCCQQDSSDNW